MPRAIYAAIVSNISLSHTSHFLFCILLLVLIWAHEWERWNVFEARKQETVQTAGRPTDSGLQWLADFSSNLIMYVTKQGSLKCLAQEAEVNQAKHCALGTQAVRTEVAARSTLGVIKCTLIMITYDGIIVYLCLL